MKKLYEIQQELKVARTRENAFIRGFKYWNVEDILENLKPIMGRHQCDLHMTDEVEVLPLESVWYDDRGNRLETKGVLLLKATATLTDVETGESVSSVGCAVYEKKKGNDSQQSTGVTSTYARKYALNGLFAINDCRDSDELPPDDAVRDDGSIQNGDARPPQYARTQRRADVNAKFGGLSKEDYDRMVDMAARGQRAKDGKEMRDWYRDVYGASAVQLKLFEASVADRRTEIDKEEGQKAALELGMSQPKPQQPVTEPSPKPEPAGAGDDEDLPF